MESIALTFIVTFLAGLVAGALSSMADNRYRAPEYDHSEREDIIYRKSSQARLASAVVFIAWTSMLFMVVAIIVSNIGGLNPPIEYIVYYPAGVMIACALLFFAMGFRLKCYECSKHILMQQSKDQKYAKSGFVLDGWSSVVVDVLLKGRFQCMSCGQRYLVK